MPCRDVGGSFFLVSVVICLVVGSSYAENCYTKRFDPNCEDCLGGPCAGNSYCVNYCVIPPPARASGPGFSTIFKNGELTVAQVLPNSPAQFSGIEVGDVVA